MRISGGDKNSFFRMVKLFVGRNIRHQTKNLSLSSDDKFRVLIQLALIEVQINIEGKQVI